MQDEKIIVIGAGVGGLVAAGLLAARGLDVTVVDKEMAPGGKMRQLFPAGRPIDAGPTVFTMRWVFDEIFEAMGESLDGALGLTRLPVLARHAWPDGSRLDLFAEQEASRAAIAAFAGEAEAGRFADFCAQAEKTYRTLERPFLRASATSAPGLTWRIGARHIRDMANIQPFATLWSALGRHFRDPRLRQLFGRYATYAGSSPFEAPATLMLIAHVEQAGVWSVAGGMHAVAKALAEAAARHGAHFRWGAACTGIETKGGRVSAVTLADGTCLPAGRVIANCDPSALAAGLLGPDVRRATPAVAPARRSLSALVWAVDGPTRGFPLQRHNVFFSADYAREFDQMGRDGVPPEDPTIYVCAQDREQPGPALAPGAAERLQIIMNAPARGDTHPLDTKEIAACETRMMARLGQAGLQIDMGNSLGILTTPQGFDTLFPATGGALYGRATHGWAAAFQRPSARTRIGGLFLAGGATHPGAGVPMAALSGCRAAESVLADRASTRSSRPVAIAGGMSMRSAKTGDMA